MPFARPSLAELVAQVTGDLRGSLSVAGPLLRRAMVDVLGRVFAGAVHTLHGYIAWAVEQLFAQTAEREALLARAAPYGITPIAAEYATGVVVVTGTDGSTVLADTILRRDAATAYRVTTGGVIGGGDATVIVSAVLAGALGNMAAGETLTFEAPVPGVNSTATVDTGGLTGGVDEEGLEEVRDRFLLRLREPPEGGADQDYEAWALAVAGVTRAWVYPHELGLGTVVVRFVMDDPARISIYPDSGEVADVQDALEAQRPITAEVTALAPTALAVAFTIHIVPDTADTRTAVTAELVDLFARAGEPGDGAGRGTVLLSQIRTAVGVAEGVTDYTVTVPAANVVPGTGELPTVGAITWT